MEMNLKVTRSDTEICLEKQRFSRVCRGHDCDTRTDRLNKWASSHATNSWGSTQAGAMIKSSATQR
jgi:hypothetical protein